MTGVWPLYWPLIRTGAGACPVRISTVRPSDGRAGTGLSVPQAAVGTRFASRGVNSGNIGSAVDPSGISVGGQRGPRGSVASGLSGACPLDTAAVARRGLGVTPCGGLSCKSDADRRGLGAGRSAAPGVCCVTGFASLGMAGGAAGTRRDSGGAVSWGCAGCLGARRVVPGGSGERWSASRGLADSAPSESAGRSAVAVTRGSARAVEGDVSCWDGSVCCSAPCGGCAPWSVAFGVTGTTGIGCMASATVSASILKLRTDTGRGSQDYWQPRALDRRRQRQ